MNEQTNSIPEKDRSIVLKCFKCRKKSHIGITCICGNFFCIKHRYLESHECPNLIQKIQNDKKLQSDILFNNSVKQNKIQKI